MAAPTPETHAGDAANPWDDVAADYDAHTSPHNAEIAEVVLDRLGLAPGAHLLDVAAGSGALTLAAARRGMEVTAFDLSSAMIDLLRAKVAAEDLAGPVHLSVMDGQQLELGDGSFDLAVSQFGVMSFPDLVGGIREMGRVTRPGGLVVMVTLGGLPTEVEYMAVAFDAIGAVDPEFAGVPSDPPVPPFTVADPSALHDRMVDAGLDDVAVERIVVPQRFPSARVLWDSIVSSNPIAGHLVAHLTEGQVAGALAHIDAVLEERADGDGPGAVLEAVANLGVGTTPG
ncbi:MAG: methyltransferase domain-containing protein [Actinomycetota bacterium]|nr:methyltransferase domain-containing protein [Actinomycetota bacterium]